MLRGDHSGKNGRSIERSGNARNGARAASRYPEDPDSSTEVETGSIEGGT
jgi:hypothetical protein